MTDFFIPLQADEEWQCSTLSNTVIVISVWNIVQEIQSVTIEALNNMNRNLSFEFRRSHREQIAAIQQHRLSRGDVMNDMLSDYGLRFFHHSPNHVERFPLPQSSLRQIQTSPYFENRLHSNNKLQNDVHLSSKHHRKTLPPNLSHPNFIQSHKVLLPMTSPKGTPVRISFSYSNQPKQRMGSTILLASLTGSPQSLSQQGDSRKRKLKRQEKQLRCKLSSNEFNQFYAPLKFSRKGQKRSAIGNLGIYRSQPNIKTSEMLKSFQYSCKEVRNDRINSSKMASTQATQSFHENKKSGLSSVRQLVGSSQRLSNEFPSKKMIDYDSANTLISQMPSGKILNKTILFGTNYDFGGVMNEANNNQIPTNASITTDKNINSSSFKEVEDRHWKSHVKCLLSSQHESENMKQSIHCGPDVRHQRFKCQALDGFGREIKESYIPHNE